MGRSKDDGLTMDQDLEASWPSCEALRRNHAKPWIARGSCCRARRRNHGAPEIKTRVELAGATSTCTRWRTKWHACILDKLPCNAKTTRYAPCQQWHPTQGIVLLPTSRTSPPRVLLFDSLNPLRENLSFLRMLHSMLMAVLRMAREGWSLSARHRARMEGAMPA